MKVFLVLYSDMPYEPWVNYSAFKTREAAKVFIKERSSEDNLLESFIIEELEVEE